MKFRWDKKYLYWGITAFCVIALSIIFYYILFHSQNLKAGLGKLISVCMPIIYGLVLAYLLNPVLNMVENRMMKPIYEKAKLDTIKNKKKIRNFSIVITVLIFFLILYGFFSMVIPELIKSIQSIILQFPIYVNNLESWIQELFSNNLKLERTISQLFDRYSPDIIKWMNDTLMPKINVILMELSLSVIGFAKFLWNFIIGLIISIYVMGLKETFAAQGKKIIFALFTPEHAGNLINDIRFVDKTFGGFIVGKLIDSAIIGVLCFLGMSLLKLPYVVLVSVIVGITNIIPFFGPYLGAIPSAILILMVSPPKVIPFIIFILVLQQFDGNFLGPKILGNSTGLNSFWVIFSITLFGGFFGILGMAVGVPIFAVIYALLKRRCSVMLGKKGLSMDTGDYMGREDYENANYVPLTQGEKEKSGQKKFSFNQFSKKQENGKNDSEKK